MFWIYPLRSTWFGGFSLIISTQSPKTCMFKWIGDSKLPLVVSLRVKGVSVCVQDVFPPNYKEITNGWIFTELAFTSKASSNLCMYWTFCWLNLDRSSFAGYQHWTGAKWDKQCGFSLSLRSLWSSSSSSQMVVDIFIRLIWRTLGHFVSQIRCRWLRFSSLYTKPLETFYTNTWKTTLYSTMAPEVLLKVVSIEGKLGLLCVAVELCEWE